MDDHAPSLELPAPDVARRAVHDARRGFERTLATWTMDLLTLRRAGVIQTTWTTGDGSSDWAAAA